MVRLHVRTMENGLEQSNSGGRKPDGGWGAAAGVPERDDEGLQPRHWGWRKADKLKGREK